MKLPDEVDIIFGLIELAGAHLRRSGKRDAVSNNAYRELMATKMLKAQLAMLASERKYTSMVPTFSSVAPVIKMKKRGNDAVRRS